MRVTYAFIYYFTVVMIALTVSLILLYFKPVRHLFFNLSRKIQLGNFPVYQLAFWIVFIIICIVLADAVTTYFSMKELLGDLSGYKVDTFEAIKSSQKEDYLSIYKKLREFHMAQRNFMLTGSALSTMFIFNRFLATFRKWYDLQKEYENRKQVPVQGKKSA